MPLHTCVSPEGRFVFGIHKPSFRVTNHRVHGHTETLGMLEDKEQKVSLGSMSFKEMMAKKMELNKLAFPGEFLFLLRIRFGLMSVLEKLGAVANWRKLESEAIHAVM